MIPNIRYYLLALAFFTFAACGPGKSAVVNPIVEPIYVARGNEPSWSVRITPEQITFSRLGMEKEVYPNRTPELKDKTITYLSQGDAGEIRVTFLEESCTDNMSGEIFAYQVTVEKDGKQWQGCGGTE